MNSPPLVMLPGIAAALLSVTTGELAAMIRRHQFEFTELAPGGKPGDRGRRRWGLTERQLSRIVAGQARSFAPEPSPEPEHYAVAGAESRLRRRGK